MTASEMPKPPGARYEIRVGGIPRTMRDREAVACEAARELERQNPSVEVVDLRTGAVVPHHKAG
ncbi:MAG TPA: hypothetical protein VKX28_26760 [Xanthobacteraceae bacterium]|nr:hypothetical protein [Xanthobacteraceae bacterium]